MRKPGKEGWSDRASTQDTAAEGAADKARESVAGGTAAARLLARAVERVARDSTGSDPSLLAPAEEFIAEVRGVAALVENASAEPSLEGRTAAEKAVTRLAVDRLRQALLGLEGASPRGGTRAGAPKHDKERDALVTLLRRLESIRGAATAARDEGLAAQLSGSGALDLVVEVAHDLRSPLTSIMFLSETLRRGQSGPITDVQRQQLGIIYSAALGLVSVANDLMDLARDGDPAELADFASEPFSLAETLESVHNMVRPMLEEKKLQFVYQLPDRDVRHGKAVPLNRTLLNLVTNAIKFTEAGMVEVVVRKTRGTRVEVSVRDTGRGMDPSTVESIYETFRRGHTRTGYRFSDTGLGMSLCRRMVALMGGELQVRSEPGEGTRFWFEIDLPPAGER